MVQRSQRPEYTVCAGASFAMEATFQLVQRKTRYLLIDLQNLHYWKLSMRPRAQSCICLYEMTEKQV